MTRCWGSHLNDNIAVLSLLYILVVFELSFLNSVYCTGMSETVQDRAICKSDFADWTLRPCPCAAALTILHGGIVFPLLWFVMQRYWWRWSFCGNQSHSEATYRPRQQCLTDFWDAAWCFSRYVSWMLWILCHISLYTWCHCEDISFRIYKFLTRDICHHTWLIVVGSTQPEAVGAHQAAMEASLSVEVSMIVLDTVTLYVNSFKVISFCTA